MVEWLEAMLLNPLNLNVRECRFIRPARQNAKGAIALVTPGASGNLRHFRQVQPLSTLQWFLA
jgi:hypothetical protein